jgi:pimeloyl-ACP methyl ester carboxylesterase
MPKAKINGITIDYMVEGQGEPLIMIIGLGSDQSNWRLQTGLFKKYYRTITFDNRGVGKSDKPTGPYTINMMAEDTISLMDHLGIEKTHLLGVSMGGMIAQELAINHPERVDKLVLGCTFARRNGTSGFSSEVTRALEAYDRSSRDVASLRNLVNIIINLSFNKRSYRILALPLMKVAIRTSTLDGFIDQLEAVLAHDAADRLGQIKAPTLVMTGTEDRVIKPVSSEVIANLLPRAKLVKVEGGSHGFSGEMSSKFNREVLDFLTK